MLQTVLESLSSRILKDNSSEINVDCVGPDQEVSEECSIIVTVLETFL